MVPCSGCEPCGIVIGEYRQPPCGQIDVKDACSATWLIFTTVQATVGCMRGPDTSDIGYAYSSVSMAEVNTKLIRGFELA